MFRQQFFYIHHKTPFINDVLVVLYDLCKRFCNMLFYFNIIAASVYRGQHALNCYIPVLKREKESCGMVDTRVILLYNKLVCNV